MNSNNSNEANSNPDDERRPEPGGPRRDFTVRLPPDLDLESLVLQDRYTLLDEKLDTIVAASSTPPAWRDAWVRSRRGRQLRPREDRASPEERLAVWQMVRDSGALPEDAGFFLVADEVIHLAELRLSESLAEIDRRIDAFAAEHGLEEWGDQRDPYAGDGADFRERCPLDWDGQYVGMLRRHGEEELARLYRTDRERFGARLAAGRACFYPPDSGRAGGREEEVKHPPPAWLEGFLDEVAPFVLVQKTPATLEVQFVENADGAEAAAHLRPEEEVSGPLDGRRVPRPFVADVEGIRALFEVVDRCEYRPSDEDPCLLVGGSYRGRRLSFRLLSVPAGEDWPLDRDGG
jgi:hypothetical protein